MQEENEFQTDQSPPDERGMTTAELLGNAALAIFALVVIWIAMEQMGIEVVNYIKGKILR